VKKILIIGSKGFIGSHALAYFSSLKDLECWGCDVVVDYVSERYLLIDSSNSDYMEVFENGQFDLCINCSGAASVPDSLLHPLRDFSLNTHNVFKILEAIRKHAPHCKFIQLSSAAVYGNPSKLPVAESDACQPVSPYGLHKLYAEGICREYHQHFGIRSCCLRIFSAYGPGLRKQILWDLFKKATQKSDIVLSGTGNETRDFVFISDIVTALALIAQKGQFDAGVYNVASGSETSIKELSSLFLATMGYEGELIFSGSGRAGDPVNWRADISKLTSLGFKPSYTLEAGVINYIEWARGIE
jgi:UDP-glucose 4-epimerase